MALLAFCCELHDSLLATLSPRSTSLASYSVDGRTLGPVNLKRGCSGAGCHTSFINYIITSSSEQIPRSMFSRRNILFFGMRVCVCVCDGSNGQL